MFIFSEQNDLEWKSTLDCQLKIYNFKCNYVGPVVLMVM